MAFPTIVFDTATGSDTQASGAGPATALFGTTDASSDGTGLVVTLTAGTDLSGVDTTGLHVLFFNDATAGARNFGRITGKAGSGGATPNVTVDVAFGLTVVNKSWAIGGKRATLANTNSLKLFENNAGNGDAMPGWIIETTSGQTQSFTAAFNFRRSGNSTDGPITLRTTAGYSARTILTWNSNTAALSLGTNVVGWHFEDLELQNTNGTKTSVVAVSQTGGSPSGNTLLRLKVANSTNKFGRFLSVGTNSNYKIVGCEVGNCTLANTINGTNLSAVLIMGCWFHDNLTGPTITLGSGSGAVIVANLFTNNVGNTITSSSSSASAAFSIIANTIDGSTGDGINVTAGSSTAFYIVNNNITNCTGTAVDFGADTVARLSENGTIIDGNNTFNNSGGSYSPSGYGTNDPGVDPGYINTGALNWGVGVALSALGLPKVDYPGSTTHSYVDIGAAQRINSAGTSGGSYAFS